MCSITIYNLNTKIYLNSKIAFCSLSAVGPRDWGSQSSDPPSVEEGFLQDAEAFDDFGFIIISADLRLHFTSTLCLYAGGGVAALLVLDGLIRTPISRSARATAARPTATTAPPAGPRSVPGTPSLSWHQENSSSRNRSSSLKLSPGTLVRFFFALGLPRRSENICIN